MILTLVFYTVLIVSLNVVANTDSNLLPPGYLDDHTLTPADIMRRTYGSKWVLVVEQCQCATIWLLKACLLLMYSRFTAATYPIQNLLVKLLLAYVVLTFVVMELLYFTCWCRPFSDYWAVPTPNPQCSAATNHLITNAVFNISSDVAVLCVTLPLFARSHLPFSRKASLCVIFSLGIFTIISAVLNKYYSFANPFSDNWTYWYLREASTAVLVANLPFLWGVLKGVFHLTTGTHEELSSTHPSERRKRQLRLGQLRHLSMKDSTSRKITEKGPDSSGGITALRLDDDEAAQMQAQREEYEMNTTTQHSPPNLQRRTTVEELLENEHFDAKEDAKYFGRSAGDVV